MLNSILGRILLGRWELGAVPVPAAQTGSFTATLSPRVVIASSGGTQNGYTSVLGTIRLGIFELGAVPAISVTSRETRGKGSYQCRPFPDVLAKPAPPTGDFTGTAFPDVSVRGNKGALLVILSAFPDVRVAGINSYPTGSFDCAAFPDVDLTGVRPGAVICKPFPDVALNPLTGKQIDCVVGPNPPDANIVNYVF